MRLVAAFAVFLGCVFSGLWLITHHGAQAPDPKGLSTSAQTLADKSEDDVFYRSVGEAPAGFPPGDGRKATPAADGLQASYTLEIKLMTSREDAERLIDLLTDQGVEAYFTPLSRGGRVIYRVRQGIFDSEAEAQRAQLALTRDYSVQSKVVRLQ